MRSTVVAIVAALLLIGSALTLSGCGGDQAAAPATPPANPAPAASGGSGSLGASSETTGLSPKPVTTPTQFPLITTATAPAAVYDAVKAKQPLFLWYFDSTMPVTTDQREQIVPLEKKYRGLVDFVSYDLRSALVSKPSQTAQLSMKLSQTLKVTSMPYIVIVGPDGNIHWQSSGFIDEKILDRELQSVAR